MNTNHSRRSFLRNATLSAAGTAISSVALSGAIGAPLAGEGLSVGASTIRALIAAHEHARAAAAEAWQQLEEAEAAYVAPRILVPMDITPTGFSRGRFELGTISQPEIEREIRANHAKLLRTCDSEFFAGMVPGYVQPMIAAIETSLDTCLRALSDAVEETRRHREASGISALNDLAEEADDERWSARNAILSYRPTSVADAAVKAAWLTEQFNGPRPRDSMDETALGLLIQSIGATS